MGKTSGDDLAAVLALARCPPLPSLWLRPLFQPPSTWRDWEGWGLGWGGGDGDGEGGREGVVTGGSAPCTPPGFPSGWHYAIAF